MNNRVSGELLVKLPEKGTCKFQIVDLQGKTISAQEIYGESIIIPYSDCMPGIYFLHIQSKDHSVTKKIFIE
jgi:hypothetical protein